MTHTHTSILGCAGLLAGAMISLPSSVSAQSAPTMTDGAKWETSAAAGFTLTRGNSDTLLGTADITSSRKWGQHELTAAANLTYGENSGTKNADSQSISLQYNRLVSERFFVYGRAEWMRDAISDIDYRISVSPGAGYYFWKDANKGFLRGEVGPGYVFERKGGVNDDYLTLRLAERFEYKLSDTAKLWQSIEFTPEVSDWDNFQLVAEVGVDVTLVKNLSMRAYVQNVYNNQPAAGRDRNDLKLVTALAYKF